MMCNFILQAFYYILRHVIFSNFKIIRKTNRIINQTILFLKCMFLNKNLQFDRVLRFFFWCLLRVWWVWRCQKQQHNEERIVNVIFEVPFPSLIEVFCVTKRKCDDFFVPEHLFRGQLFLSAFFPGIWFFCYQVHKMKHWKL